MKKYLSLLLAVIILLSFAACSGNGGQTANATQEPTEAPTPKPTPTPEPTPTPLPHISWTLKYYVDDFNEPTDEAYIAGLFSGTFSNKYYQNRDLEAAVFLGPVMNKKNRDYISIKLYEYGSSLVWFRKSSKVLVKVKINGETYQSFIAINDYMDAEYIFIDMDKESTLYSKILEALDNNIPISFMIGTGEYINHSIDIADETYVFKVDSYGLGEIEHDWTY